MLRTFSSAADQIRPGYNARKNIGEVARMPIFKFCPECGRPLSLPAGPPEQVLFQSCSQCGATHFKNAKPSVSAVVVHDGKILLARRGREPFLGWWNLPGGFLDPWEHPTAGAIREVAEESGLVVRLGKLLEVAVYRYGERGDYLLNLCYLARVVGGELGAADDAAEVRWFAPDDLPEQIAFMNNLPALVAQVELE
jgi:8-oxo-dGTP diphosphatase